MHSDNIYSTLLHNFILYIFWLSIIHKLKFCNSTLNTCRHIVILFDTKKYQKMNPY